MKVSVIVPIYNVEKFIGECIESIINQDYKELEIILVDDGTKDNSGKICDEYAKKDSRIKVIHKKNGGVSSARNIGIEQCSGDYICFIDGDDYVSNDYVSYMLKLAMDNDCEVVCSAQMFSHFDKTQFKDNRIRVVSGEEATEAILCYRLPIGVNAKLFKKEFILDNLRFLEELVIGEGFNFNTMAFQLSKKVCIGYKKIYFYRKDNPTSVTTTYNEIKWNNGIYALERIKKDFIIHSKKLLKAWEYAYWRTNSDAYDLLIISKEEKKYIDTYKKFKKIIRKGFFYSLKVPVSNKDRLRAFVMMICPRIIPYLMIIRRRINKIKF